MLSTITAETLLCILVLLIAFLLYRFFRSLWEWIRWRTYKEDEQQCVDWDLVLKNIEDAEEARRKYRKPPPDDPPGTTLVPVNRPIKPTLSGADAKPFPPEKEV